MRYLCPLCKLPLESGAEFYECEKSPSHFYFRKIKSKIERVAIKLFEINIEIDLWDDQIGKETMIMVNNQFDDACKFQYLIFDIQDINSLTKEKIINRVNGVLLFQ